MKKVALATVAVVLSLASVATAQDWARKKLEASPRHQEWVKVTKGARTVQAFLVFPETKARAAAVVVIHENRGLTDWVRLVADRLAEAGVIAIAPDLLSGAAPGRGKTSEFKDEDAAREAISGLPPDQVTSDLQAAADYVKALPGARGALAVAGFCWGGGQSFRLATNRRDLKATYVFYGVGPQDAESLGRIASPVYGFYGGNDARVNATLPSVAEGMKAKGRTFEPVTYDGAGHGFMRAGEEPEASAPNAKAREEAWARWRELLKKL
jgi:carboxymethylenebutenolidase